MRILSQLGTRHQTYNTMSSYEPDTGDISLSLPNSRMDIPSTSRLGQIPQPRTPDVIVPVPERLNRTLWNRSNAAGLGLGRADNPSSDSLETVGAGPSTMTMNTDRRGSESRYLKHLDPFDSPSSSMQLQRSRSLNDKTSLGPSTSGSSISAPSPSSKLGWARRPGEPRPPPLLDSRAGGSMARWIKEIVVCNFDLERGPVIERRVVGRRWGPGEKENV